MKKYIIGILIILSLISICITIINYINKNMENNEKIIKDAQYRKGLSIAFFNATNASIELVKTEKKEWIDEKSMLDTIIRYRDFFLQEHKNYYANVIANIGQNYKVEDAIAKLEATKNIEELKSVWLLFSEDERRDDEIRNKALELKNKYNEKTSN